MIWAPKRDAEDCQTCACSRHFCPGGGQAEDMGTVRHLHGIELELWWGRVAERPWPSSASLPVLDTVLRAPQSAGSRIDGFIILIMTFDICLPHETLSSLKAGSLSGLVTAEFPGPSSVFAT